MNPKRRLAFAAISLCALIGSLACITIERRIEITPEAVPEEIQGARWRSLPVTYCVSLEPVGFVEFEEFEAATARAFETWGVATDYQGACDSAPTQSNGTNEIGWGTLEQRGPGVHEAGTTYLLYRQCGTICPGGIRTQIIEADVLIEADPPRTRRNSNCLFSVLLHEIGHFVGVQHLPSPALMAPASTSCPQDLTDADRAAFDAIYGPRE